MRIKVETPDGKVVERVAKVVPCGNFQMLVVRYKNNEYLVNEGDEYLHRFPPVFKLGKKL